MKTSKSLAYFSLLAALLLLDACSGGDSDATVDSGVAVDATVGTGEIMVT